MASKFLAPLDLSNFTNTPLANTSVGFVKVYVKNNYLTYLLPSGLENDIVLSRPLDGLTIPTLATGIVSSDSLLIALSKLQASLNNIVLTGDVTGTASYISGLLTINTTLGSGITETDPVFTASPSYGITGANITDWNTAYSWGNHATAGYLTTSLAATTYVSLSGSYSNPTWLTTLAWSKITGAPAFLTTETDPIFTASPAFGITSTNISNWNTAYGWGNHASAGYVTTAGARTAISLTTSGTSGAATYDNITGVLNIPNYASGLTIGSTAIASGTEGRILYEGAGNVLQQSANLVWDNASNLLKIANAKLEGGEFYSSYQPKLNLSANSGFSAIQYEFNTAAFLVGYVNVYGIGGAQDVFFQGNPNSTNSYVALEAINSAGLILATANNTNPIQFRINRGLRATLNNVGFGYGVVPTAPLHAKGNSDSVGNVFIAENLSNTANLTLANNGVITHTFTDTDYSAVATGRAVIFKRGTRELSFGTRATFATGFNPVSNVSIIQSTNSSASAPLKINPYGGEIHIGSVNNKVIIGNATDTHSTQTVIISGGDGSFNVPNLTVSSQGYNGGLRMWGFGNDGEYFNSVIRGESDNILFRNQLIQIGTSSPSSFSASFATQARLEINTVHRTMSDSTTQNQGNSYYQRFSYYKTGAASDRFSYMMIGSHIASGMGMQMKVSPNAVAYTNGTITLNPYGGNVGVGIATAPTATLHVKGNGSTHITSSFRVENLANSASFTFRDDGSFVLLGDNGYGGANTPILSMRNTYHELFIGGSTFTNAGYITQSFCFSGGMTATRFQGMQLENAAIADLNATSGTYRAFEIIGSRFGSTLYGVFNPTSGNAIYKHINISTGVNQTGTASGAVYGIDYNPTITAILGAHYGFLIRPTTLNGIGLGATLPAATLHINSPNTVKPLKVDVGTVDSALLVESTGEVTTRKFKWTIDLMLFTTIDLVADVNFKIVSVTNIKNSPTTTLQVNSSPYTLGTNITSGDTINVQVSTLSVVRLNCELI